MVDVAVFLVGCGVGSYWTRRYLGKRRVMMEGFLGKLHNEFGDQEHQ